MKSNQNLNNNLGQTKSRLAFSLIELSVVLFIIGILVLGIVKGSRMIYAAKLQSARSLTEGSPVTSIEGVLLWLEPTIEKNISTSERSNGTKVTNWYDYNPQSKDGLVATQATASNKPVYEESAINGLPAIRFSNGQAGGTGSNGNLQINLPKYSGTTLHAFLVCKRIAYVANSNYVAFYNSTGQDWDNTQSMMMNWQGSATTFRAIRSSHLATFTHPNNGSPYIISTKFNGTTNTSYLNGIAGTTTANVTGNFGFDKVIIGARSDTNNSINGNIAEIIVFDHALTSSEDTEVLRYLGKKWDIKVP
ncbi:MAG: hypothetical protein K0R25_602 [Rickettsiaceae bacterium]|jgi:prepilin-type N-terminal cleavage/methylation domain-containing protein|nr:hypothetical protein [Rickettsiaceae bacterium]